MFQFWNCTLFCLDRYSYYQPVYHQHSAFTQNWQFKKHKPSLYIQGRIHMYKNILSWSISWYIQKTVHSQFSTRKTISNQHYATVQSCYLTKKVANHQMSLQSIYHLQIPGASVRLKESISSYFEAYTKAHNCIYMKKFWIIIIIFFQYKRDIASINKCTTTK